MSASPYKPPKDLKSRVKESYDAIGPSYNSWTIHNPAHRLAFLDKLLRLLPTPVEDDELIQVLELGSGAGVPVTEKLLNDGRFFVTANDISTTQIMLGKALCGGTGRVDWIESDMLELVFADRTFDAVLAFYSLIHLPREEQETMIRRIFRWLKPGGYALLNFATEDMEGVVMERWFGEQGWMFWSGWGADVTQEKIAEAGFKIVFNEISQDDSQSSFLWVIAKVP